MDESWTPFLTNLNALTTGLFLLTAFGLLAVRQTKACLNLFVLQSLLLVFSSLLLGLKHSETHLYGVAAVNILSKVLLVPWLLKRTVPEEIYTRREIEQALNVPAALLIALGLSILAYFAAAPLSKSLFGYYESSNLPIGIAGLLLGAFTLAVRREAVPLLLGLLAMENGAFLAGIAIARKLPLMVELAVAMDGLMVVFIMGLLTRAVQQQAGTTAIGKLANLKESASRSTLTRKGLK